MPIPVSQLEFKGSPVEQMSVQYKTWFWDASAELVAGEILSNPTCQVLKYDPAFPEDTQDVTSTVVDPATPVVVVTPGVHNNQVQVGILNNTLTPGYNYRVVLTAVGDQGTTPGGFFVLKCVI